MKMNTANYLDQKYEQAKWYKIDVLLDWDPEELYSNVAIFINGTYIMQTPFYSNDRDIMMECDKRFVNTLALYNLTPGTSSSFKDIRLCTDLCPGTQESDFPLTYGDEEEVIVDQVTETETEDQDAPEVDSEAEATGQTTVDVGTGETEETEEVEKVTEMRKIILEDPFVVFDSASTIVSLTAIWTLLFIY